MVAKRNKVQAESGLDIGSVNLPTVFDRINTGKADKFKPRVNTHKKMKRGQSEIGQLFADHYEELAYQTEGSGSGATQRKHLMKPDDAKALAGDVRVSNSLFVLEVKAGYDGVVMNDLFAFDEDRTGKDTRNQIEAWFDEVNGYAELTGFMPIIALRQTRKPWIIFYPQSFDDLFMPYIGPSSTTMRYHGWTIVRWTDFSRIPKHLLFKGGESTNAGSGQSGT